MGAGRGLRRPGIGRGKRAGEREDGSGHGGWLGWGGVIILLPGWGQSSGGRIGSGEEGAEAQGSDGQGRTGGGDRCRLEPGLGYSVSRVPGLSREGDLQRGPAWGIPELTQLGPR